MGARRGSSSGGSTPSGGGARRRGTGRSIDALSRGLAAVGATTALLNWVSNSHNAMCKPQQQTMNEGLRLALTVDDAGFLLDTLTGVLAQWPNGVATALTG